MTEFSIPMMITPSLIERTISINEELEKQEKEKKSKTRRITSVFVALSKDSPDALGWENYRDHSYPLSDGTLSSIKSLSFITDAAKIYKEHGIIVQYCLNSTRTLTAEKLYEIRPKIFRLCDNLLKGGISHIKVSNLLLFDFISNYYKDAFTYYLSTTKEYHSIRQFEILLEEHPLITEVCLSSNLNRNYLFIRNFNDKFKGKVTPEIMVNEGCIYACPWRMDHTPHSSHSHQEAFKKALSSGKIDMTARACSYYTDSCSNVRNTTEEYFLRRTVLPFQLPVLEEWGISKFKFAGRDMQTPYLFDTIETYLLGIEDKSLYEDKPWDWFNNYSLPKKDAFTISDAFPYYPEYHKFESRGALCDVYCGTKCTYCRDLASQLDRVRRHI